MRFGDDWTGTFIRGDDAFGYALMLERFINGPVAGDSSPLGMPLSPEIAKAVLAGLLEVLKCSNEQTGVKDCQRLKSFDECLVPEGTPDTRQTAGWDPVAWDQKLDTLGEPDPEPDPKT